MVEIAYQSIISVVHHRDEITDLLNMLLANGNEKPGDGAQLACKEIRPARANDKGACAWKGPHSSRHGRGSSVDEEREDIDRACKNDERRRTYFTNLSYDTAT